MKVLKTSFGVMRSVIFLVAILTMPLFAAESSEKVFGKGHPFTVEGLPNGPLKAKLKELSPAAKSKAMGWLHRIQFSKNDAAHCIRVDASGGIYIVCPGGGHKSDNGTVASSLSSTSIGTNAAVPVSSPPAYHSKPGASTHIYLDFNGAIVSGTNWNLTNGVISWDVKAYSQDGDFATFNDSEQTWMRRIYERVAEDYAPFNVNVTTDVAYDPDVTGGQNNIGWLLICETTDKNNIALPHQGSGGVAYVDAFGRSDYASTYQPAWVSSTIGGSTNRAGNESYVAEAASHEMGHNMGLSHDGTSSQAYYGGHPATSTAPSWGPIMGTGYDQNVSQWSNGGYFNSNEPEDDLQIISGKVGYQTDDHGDDSSNATFLFAASDGAINESGIIETTGEVDVFSFSTDAGAITINATPYKSDTDTWGGNLDIKLELYDSSGSLVASDNPLADVKASITTTVNAGTYFVYVNPVSAGLPLTTSPSGYSLYGSLGQYTLSGNVVGGSSAGVVIGQTGGSTGVTEGGATDSYTLVLNAQPSGNVTVSVTPDSQVTVFPSSVTFTTTDWNSPKTVTVTAVNDTAIEGDHSATITHSASSADSNFNGVPIQSLSVSISDDEAPPTNPSVTLSVDNASISENGGIATVTATLDIVANTDITVYLGFTGTAVTVQDYVTSFTSIVISAGSLSGTTLITAVDDAVDEPDETVIVDITDITNGIEYGTQQETVTIVDNDGPGVSLSVDTISIAENGGTATFTATLSTLLSQDVTVNFGYSGSAAGGTDYTTVSSAVISAGTSFTTFSVTALNDVLDEADETIVIEITSVTNAGRNGVQAQTVTIMDDDAATATVTLIPSSTFITENGGAMTLTATLSELSGQTVSVLLGFTGTALGNGTDYSTSDIQIDIAPGNFTGTATITAVDDTFYEADESIVVDILSVINGSEFGEQQATVIIENDDIYQASDDDDDDFFDDLPGCNMGTARPLSLLPYFFLLAFLWLIPRYRKSE